MQERHTSGAPAFYPLSPRISPMADVTTRSDSAASPSLTSMAASFGVELSPEHEAAFAVYTRELAAWNAHTNLTAITAPEEVRVRHFLDSLTVARIFSNPPADQPDQPVQLPPGLRLADVGTGAGFPGLPLKIVFPQIALTLIEATGKKATFLRHICDLFHLENVHIVHARAEEAGQMPDLRGQFDGVLARAVARLPVLLEYLLPLARVGGLCVAMKGSTAQQEAADSARALRTLGGELARIETVSLPTVQEAHHLVIVRKTARTPPAYPRKPGLPTQKPL